MKENKKICFGGGIGRHEGLKVKSFIEVFTNYRLFVNTSLKEI